MMRAITRSLVPSLAILLLAGCATSQPPVVSPPPPARDLGPLYLEAAMSPAVVPPAPPPTRHRGSAAAAGAGASVLAGAEIGSSGGDGLSLIVGTALGILAAPFVAVAAASTAPVTNEMRVAGTELTRAITRIRWDLAFKDAVKAALAREGRAVADTPTAEASRLKLTVEGPWLAVQSDDGLPTLTIHGELMRGGDCLLDRRWRWNGDSDDFVDLGTDQARAYRTQMERGLGILADAVVADVFRSETSAPGSEQAGVKKGGLPPVANNPMTFQEQVGSWEVSELDGRRCSGFRDQ